MIQRIILTGATGLIGTAIIRRAITKGIHVTCIVNPNSTRLSNIPLDDRVSIVSCRLSDFSSFRLPGSFDVLIHLAWEKTFTFERDDAEVQMRNIQYTLEAVKMAKCCGCSTFVGIGSQAEFGIQSVPLTSNLSVHPESGYGIAKYAAGKLSGMLCKSLGMRQNWVRILSVYGPNDGPNSLISYLIKEFKAGRSPELTKCEQIWDYLYADDAADAILAIAENGKDGKTYPLGSGRGRKLSEYVEDIRAAIDPSIEIRYGAKDYFPHQPMFLVADIQDLYEDTGWMPRYSFSEGVRLFL